MILSKRLYPGSAIGIIGGGQLGKMLAQSALRMGYKVIILDPSEDAPAKSTCHTFIQADFSDQEAMEKLASLSDVVTYEFENIDAHILHALTDNFYVPQGAETVLTLQNRSSEKDAIKASGAKVVPFENVHSKSDIENFAKTYDFPVIVKTKTGGYDGKGQYYIENQAVLEEENIPFDQVDFIAEKYIDLEAEVSLTIARSTNDQVIHFPLQENLHRDQILYRTIAPSRFDYFEEAKKEAEKIMTHLHFIGVFTIEYFLSKDGALYVNEIAPRPHNSGHHSIESCNISQFDAHILAITAARMPEVYQHQNAVMMNLLGQDLDRLENDLYDQAEWNVHIYGKTSRQPNRKMGHVTVLTDDLEAELKTLERKF